jgi:hypothetical protein
MSAETILVQAALAGAELLIRQRQLAALSEAEREAIVQVTREASERRAREAHAAFDEADRLIPAAGVPA